MSISSLLFTGRDALAANQMAIDITGGNVANVNTPGYSRQRTDLESVGTVDVKGSSAQIGVTVGRVERIYDRYLESQIIGQQQNTGYSDALLQGLQNVETMIDSLQEGSLSDQLNQFWAAWENLSKNPGGQVERSALLSTAENLAASLATGQRNLGDIRTDLNRSITDVVGRVNDIAGEVADLNMRILETVGEEGDKNTLLDKRTQALTELAGLVDITYFETDTGAMNVYLSNGEPILQGGATRTLTVTANADGTSDVAFAGSAGETVNDALNKGKLGAYNALQNRIIPEYMGYFNDFTEALAEEVNELHLESFDLYQNTGVAFFEIQDADNPAGSIRVNPVVAADANRIAASTTVTGNGETASRIAAVQNELLMNNRTSSLNGFLATTMGRIGQEVSLAKTNSDRQAAIASHLDNQRESVSGVSIDEEMVRLIKYQMGYNAAGKLCSIVDEMLDTLMGLVQ